MPTPPRARPREGSSQMEWQREALTCWKRLRVRQADLARDLVKHQWVPGGSESTWKGWLSGSATGKWEMPFWLWMTVLCMAPTSVAAAMIRGVIDALDLPFTLTVNDLDPEELDDVDIQGEHFEIATTAVQLSGKASHPHLVDTSVDLRELGDKCHSVASAQARQRRREERRARKSA